MTPNATFRLGRLGRGCFAATLALVPFWIVGQLARDATWLTGLCFYVPSIFLAGLLLAWAVVHVWKQRPRTAALAAGLALLPLGSVLWFENHATSRATTRGDVRLVHWNVGGRLGPGMRDLLRERRADVYVLSEIPGPVSVEAFRAALGAGYEAQVLGNLAVVARGQVQLNGWLLNRDRARVHSLTWRRAGRELPLLVVDLPSEVRVHRDPLLREVDRLIEQHQPDLVVGDFNAPRRSLGLESLPAGYQHAYDTVGGGYGYTWPTPVPMYALDQCIHSTRIAPARYRLRTSQSSDHRMQVFDFSDAHEGSPSR